MLKKHAGESHNIRACKTLAHQLSNAEGSASLMLYQVLLALSVPDHFCTPRQFLLDLMTNLQHAVFLFDTLLLFQT